VKKQLASLLITAFFLCNATVCSAQKEATPGKAEWVSDKGFWVVESNVHNPKNSVVYFYTLDRVLVYKETLNGVKLKLKKKKVLLHLKGVLEQSVTAWEAQHVATENKMLLAVALKQ
jgi:hypothetical protein